MDARNIIASFGGTTATARIVGVGASAVSNWKRDNRIPPHVHTRLLIAAEEKGLPLSPRDFLERPAEEGRAA